MLTITQWARIHGEEYGYKTGKTESLAYLIHHNRDRIPGIVQREGSNRRWYVKNERGVRDFLKGHKKGVRRNKTIRPDVLSLHRLLRERQHTIDLLIRELDAVRAERDELKRKFSVQAAFEELLGSK